MSREILFRAKRIEDAEWVYGYYVKQVDAFGAVHRIYHSASDPDDSNAVYEVQKNTVCEYTGLTDKNGNKIFDGDIVISPHGTMGYVEWQNGECAYLVNILNDLQTMDEFEYEVIGNIYDNPKLLGAQE